MASSQDVNYQAFLSAFQSLEDPSRTAALVQNCNDEHLIADHGVLDGVGESLNGHAVIAMPF